MTTDELTRKDGDRWHFSVDGSINLLELIPAEKFRDGDTASGQHPVLGTLMLWRFRQAGLAWEPAAPWSKRDARKAVEAAALVLVVTDSGVQSTSTPPRWRRRWKN
jgi:hypothetical protein